MTYDYSQSPGPIAPYKWVKKAIEHLISGDPQNAHKILLGLNFYGYDYGDKNVEPILGNKFLEMIEKMKPKIHWNKEFREHYFEYKDKRGSKHIVYYPSLQVWNHLLNSS
jgi:spore germination protein YaaH